MLVTYLDQRCHYAKGSTVLIFERELPVLHARTDVHLVAFTASQQETSQKMQISFLVGNMKSCRILCLLTLPFPDPCGEHRQSTENIPHYHDYRPISWQILV